MNEPLPGVEIDITSGNFFEYGGKTNMNGEYVTNIRSPRAKYLEPGGEVKIYAFRRGYEVLEATYNINRFAGKNSHKYILKKKVEKEILLRGVVQDRQTEETLEGVEIRIMTKGFSNSSYYTDHFGFHFNLFRRDLISHESIEIQFFKEGYKLDRKEIPINPSGNIPFQEILLKKKLGPNPIKH